MRPKDIHKLIRHLEARPSDELDRRIDALLALQGGAASVAAVRLARRSRITRLALAAVVLLAVAVSIPFFNGDNSNIWARVLENTGNINNYTFSIVKSQKTPGPGATEIATQTQVWYISQERGMLIETYVEGSPEEKLYAPRDSNEWVQVYPAAKEYLRIPRSEPYVSETPKEMTYWLLQGDYVELGRKTVAGRVLAGLTTQRLRETQSEDIEPGRSEFWFDVETKLPALIEFSFKVKSTGVLYTTRQDQYQYGVELPARLFEPNIPDDYTPPLVRGLRLFSELTGKYPSSLDETTVRRELGDRASFEDTNQVTPFPGGQYRRDPILRAVDFSLRMPGIVYYGRRVTPKDGNLILAYWGNPDQTYQVIWGDLRMETPSKDELLQRCYAAGDHACLLDFLEKDDGTRVVALAAYLGAIGDRSVIPALLRHADRWQGLPVDNPFPPAIEAIRQREAQRDPSEDYLIGRLVYANGRAVTSGWICMDARAEHADPNGYFAIAVPRVSPSMPHLGYAATQFGAVARLFFWTKEEQPDNLTIVLEWAGTVRGRVVDEDGTCRGGASIGLTAHPGEGAGESWPSGSRTRTDAEGRFVFENVPVGAPLELLVENPARTGGPLRVRLADITPDENRALGDIVVRDPAR